MSGSKIIIIRLGISVKVVLMSVKKKSLIGLGLMAHANLSVLGLC